MRRKEFTRTELAAMGERIYEARMARNLTQTELARMAGVGQTTIYMAENGKRELGALHLRDIARSLRVSADHILSGK